MQTLISCVLSVGALVVVALFTVIPNLASAQVYTGYNNYYPYSNCAQYPGNSYWNNDNCVGQGSVMVYVQVNNQYGVPVRSPADFTFYVSGAGTSQQYFTGSQNGTTVMVRGSYSISAYNQTDYTPTYTAGCSGSLALGETRTCNITLTPVNVPSYPYNYPYVAPVYPQYQYAATPVTYVAKYVPTLPNTGYEPVSQAAIAFTFALMMVLGTLLFPYVRKVFSATLR